MMTDPNDSNAGSAAVLISESSNTSVHGNSFDQTGTGISDAFANGDTNLSLYNNTFDHFNHGIEIGQNNANVISNVYIYANHLKNMNTWDSTGNWYHHDGIFFYQNTADSNTVRNFYVYNNLADGDMGNNVTAWIYFNSGLNGIYVFNNILLNPYPRSSYSQFLLEAGYAGDQNVYIENDYFDCGGGPAVRIGSINGITFQNNAMDHCGMFFYGDSGNVVGTIDHNVYGGGTPSNDSYFKWNSAYISFNAWKASGLDTHSVMPAGAGANSSGQPQSGSAMIHDGANNFANLTSSCTGNLTPLCTDYAGIIRPSSGTDNWDAGAYQYQATPLANVYIAQTAQGSNNGTSCANAYAVTFFNTAGNWGSGTGQIGPGTTVHLCGTISVANGGSGLTFQGSGLSGQPITLKWETGASVTAHYCGIASNDSGCVIVSTPAQPRSYIVLDGGTNGSIVHTSNGTGLTYQQETQAIEMESCTNCEVKNLAISNLYVESGGDATVDATEVRCITWSGSNNSIHGNTFNYVGWCLFNQLTNGDTNNSVYNNTLGNVAHGLYITGTGSVSASNFYFYGNSISGYATWDTSGCVYHNDGIHSSSSASPPYQSLSPMYIYNNTFSGPTGSCISSQIFLSPDTYNSTSQGIVRQAYIFNNVFSADAPAYNGMVTVAGGSGHLIANNTIVNSSDGGICLNWDDISGESPIRTLTFKNNAISGCSELTYSNMAGLDSNVTADYNAYANCQGGNCWYAFVPGATSNFTTYKANAYGQDQHAVANLGGTLGLNSAFVPQSGSMVIATGTNLSNLCIKNGGSLPNALCSDINGITRPSSAAWDVGAYQYTGGVSTYTIGGTLSGLTDTVVLQNNGTDNISTSTNGAFTFATATTTGGTYNVTVFTQPSGQTCGVSNGSGTVGSANVTNVLVSCSTNPTVPTTPLSLTGIASNAQVSLSWLAPSSNGGASLIQYFVQDKLHASSTFATVATTSSSTLSSIVTSLTNGTSYDFQVLAQNSVGTSSPSNTLTATPITVPGAPTMGSATAGNAQATVTFSAPGSNGGSAILYYTASSTPSNITATSATTSITVTGLTNGQPYTFKVTATNAAGTSTPSAASGSVTPSGLAPVISSFTASPPVIAPAATTTLSWLTGGATTVSINNGVGSQTATSTGSVSVSPSTTTTYTLTAANSNGTTTAAATVTVTIPTYTIGGTLSGLTDTVVLQNNGGDSLTTSANGAFTFATATTSGGTYNVTVLSQPSNQTCSVSNGSGTVSSANITSVTVSCTTNSSGGGGGGGGSSGGGGGGGGGSIAPVSSTPQPGAPSTSTSPSVLRLINSSGTLYLIKNGYRYGITSPGILYSYGFDFPDAKAATTADLAIPLGSLLLPGNGSLVKSQQDPTVYLISQNQRLGFTSASVFLALGFKWTSVLLVTNPELQALPQGSLLNNPAAAHPPGLDILDHNTIYWLAPNQTRQGYPSLAVYNSWHRDNDFSNVVPANPADLALPVAGLVSGRVIE